VLQLAVDANDRIWAAGWTNSPNFHGTLLGSFIVQLEADGSASRAAYKVPGRISSIALMPGGWFAAINEVGWLYSIGPQGQAFNTILGISNSVDYPLAASVVSPGEIVDILGVGLAPRAMSNVFGPDGRLMYTNPYVTFDGIEAPTLYFDSNTIRVIVPFEIAGRKQVFLDVEKSGHTLFPVFYDIAVADAHPTILAVVNPDGTLNSATHPAPQKSIITIYANGFGVFDPKLEDGRIVPDGSAKPVLHVSTAQLLGTSNLLFVGSAPGEVAGIVQLNVGIDSPVGLTIQAGTHQRGVQLFTH
jgi:uncharacterized protein (TIGR03437 family)